VALAEEESLVVEVGELVDELADEVGATEGISVGNGLDEREEDMVTTSWGA